MSFNTRTLQDNNMEEVEAVYQDGVLKLVSPVKITSERLFVRIINRDEILTEEDMKNIVKALKEHAEEKLSASKRCSRDL